MFNDIGNQLLQILYMLMYLFFILFIQAQFYCGMDSHVCDSYGMKTDKQFVNTFEDVIRQRGPMNILISDSAQVETRGRTHDTLRAYVIGN